MEAVEEDNVVTQARSGVGDDIRRFPSHYLEYLHATHQDQIPVDQDKTD